LTYFLGLEIDYLKKLLKDLSETDESSASRITSIRNILHILTADLRHIAEVLNVDIRQEIADYERLVSKRK